MRVSIVVPSFNQAQYLDETLCSLIAQTHPDKEIIVMDGGSTDGSVDIIKRHAAGLTYWRSGPDGGQANAIKAGFDLATGELIGWLNSDDILAEGALSRLIDAARQVGSPECVFFGGYEFIDDHGKTQEIFYGTPIVHWAARALGPAICQPGTFFGRTAYARVGGIDPQLKYGMDFDLWMKFLRAGVPYILIHDVQAKFRRHSGQKGHSVEWLKRCVAESEQARRRYDMGSKGGLRWVAAQQVHRLRQITSAGFWKMIKFRVVHRRRIRQYSTTYSD